MKKEINLETAKELYSKATSQETKDAIEKLVGKKNVIANDDDVFSITGIEDVFKRQNRDYAKFCKVLKDAGISEDGLNYELLKIGAAYLNEGWVPDYSKGNTQEKWANYWNMRGSGFVFDLSSYLCAYDCTNVGAALRFENQKKSEFAAKVFYPQYKGHYKPSMK